jgi:hypothetical protein
MAVYYYEGAKILAPFTITSNEPMFDVDTVSLRKQRTSQGVQRWEISFNIQGEFDTADDLFVASVVDFDNVKTMIMPQLPVVAKRHNMNTSPLVATAAGAGSEYVYIDSAIVDGLLPKGAFIKFSNHDKIYVVRQDVSFDGLADKYIHIYPSLSKNVNTSTSLLTGNNCVLTYYRDIDNAQGITFTDGVLSNAGTINLVEAL